MIDENTSFDGFLSTILNVIFRQQHLPLGNLSCQSRLLKNVFDRIHSGYQPSCVVNHVVTEPFGSPGQGTTSLLEHGITRLTVGELFTEVVYGVFFLSSLILLSEYTTHRVFQHSQIHNQWSSFNWRDQNRWLQ